MLLCGAAARSFFAIQSARSPDRPSAYDSPFDVSLALAVLFSIGCARLLAAIIGVAILARAGNQRNITTSLAGTFWADDANFGEGLFGKGRAGRFLGHAWLGRSVHIKQTKMAYSARIV